MFKTPLRYPGGKSKLANAILEYAPNLFEEYREPFFGGGSVLFSVLSSKKPIETIRVSDLFEELYNFWYYTKTDNKNLVSLVTELKNQNAGFGKELYAYCRSIFLSTETLCTGLEKAAAFFILNRVSFSGLTLSGGYSKAAFETRFQEQHIKRLALCEEAMANVELTNASYEELLFANSTKNTWIYLDPPYDISSKTLYGKNGDRHSSFDHEKFAANCKQCKHKLLVSYNDNDNIRELFSWANIVELKFSYNMNSLNKKVTELLIKNY